MNRDHDRRFREESVYELTEIMTENNQCSKMMLFLEVEARDMDQNAKDEIYSIFKIEVNDLNHEQMIRSVLTYPYDQPMFRITEYVSKFKTYLSKPFL